MTLFTCLVGVVAKAPYLKERWTSRDRVALWVLETVFAARYSLYLQVCDLQAREHSLKRENQSYSRKLTNVLRAYGEVAPGEEVQ